MGALIALQWIVMYAFIFISWFHQYEGNIHEANNAMIWAVWLGIMVVLTELRELGR